MKKYTYQEVFDASKKYFGGDELASKVFADKYALQDGDENYCELTPKDTHMRLASEFARIEKKYCNPMTENEIFSLLDNFKYIIPQGSPMFGIGNKYQITSISNCFVLDSPKDSYGAIMHTDQQLAHIFRRRGGIGIDISNIRPKGQSVKNAAKTTDGVGLFMERYSSTCREVATQGRRGALMLTISCHHPEIRTFINIKRNLQKVTGANVSIKMTDEFMAAVKNNEEVELKWPVDSDSPIVSKFVNAKELWNEIVESVWQSAEPGLLFWDTALKYTPAQIYKDFGFNHISTNPCGEIILSAYDSCRLLLMNLYSYVINPYLENARFDFDLFSEHVQKAQRLMDDIVDLELECIDNIIKKVESDPEPKDIKKIELDLWHKIKKACLEGRRTGLGITAMGDCLAALNIVYGSQESFKKVNKIYKYLAVNSYKSSIHLAKERGAFPIFNNKLEENHPYLERIWDSIDDDTYAVYKKHGRRNISNLTTAPAGSISCLTQTTSGIEPAFQLSYIRRKKVNSSDKNAKIDFIDQKGDAWQEFIVYHNGLKKWMEITGKTDITKSPYHGATSADCDWKASVKLQGKAQFWIDHSISKTCNVPNNTCKELISDMYMEAWKSGCKGFTVYRDGCRTGVLISEDVHKKQKENIELSRPDTIIQSHAPCRPKQLICDILHATVRGEKWTILVGLMQSDPYEIFMGKTEKYNISNKYTEGKLVKLKRGHYSLTSLTDEVLVEDVISAANNEECAWITRMMSMSLRHGIPTEYLVDQLSKDGSIVDINNVLARLLKKYIKMKTKINSDICPQCGNHEIIFSESCKKCSCGWASCG